MEIWKSIKDYECLYEVSNLGNVRRIESYVKRSNHILKVPAKIMIPADNGKGYLRVKLTKNNIAKRVLLHRIIAETFIENPYNFTTINHINGVKNDNRIINLEWTTQSENIKHAYRTGLKIYTEKMKTSCIVNFSKCKNRKIKL